MSARRAPGLGHDRTGHAEEDAMAVVHGRQEPVAGRQFALFGRQFSIMEGVLPIDRVRVSVDIIAGVTLAALAIPEVMGYTKIAGMPVITGLYTILIPIALFALFGSSRRLVVGADSATAAVMAAGLAGLAATGSPQYVALAGLLALITAAILLIARFIGLGFLADFLSRTVLIGFLTGVGIQVAIGQISGMLGLQVAVAARYRNSSLTSSNFRKQASLHW
jgi:sulfate permease, SulP family